MTRGARVASLVLLAGACGAAARSLATALSMRDGLSALLGSDVSRQLFAVEAAAFAVSGAAFWLEAREPGAIGWGVLARRATVALAAGWLAFLASVDEYEALWGRLAIGPWASLFGLQSIVARTGARAPRAVARAASVATFALAAAAIAVELGLRAVARVRPSPLFARVVLGPERLLAARRAAPGELRFGFRCNSGGHYDDEFARRADDETRVATIGDSFAQGVVPHALHFTSVAEHALGFPVDNYGFGGIGVPEYERLLVDEILSRDPSAVVVCLFLGNDLPVHGEAARAHPIARAWLSRDNVLVWILPERLRRVRAERERMGTVARVAGQRGASFFPWTDDPSLETPTFSEAAFLAMEEERMRTLAELSAADLDLCVAVLRRMRSACGSIPFAVMLAPDEAQVEDGVWSAVAARAGRELDRDAPQARLVRALRDAGIPVVDLLPLLRAVEPMHDGRRHVYHARDTHWNARGNHVAGEALVQLVRQILAR